MAGRRRPRGGHWLLLALLGGVVIAAFGLQGFTQYGIHADTPQKHATAKGNGGLGPIVDARPSPPHAMTARPGTVALTFDDGPDPEWTPQILRILAAERVPATFFAVGGRAARYPDLLRAEAAAGNEIGNHSFSNADLGTVPLWRAKMELAATQRVIGAATGHVSPLVRLPGTTSTPELRTDGLRALNRSARAGYLAVLTDRDTDAASGASAAQIVRAATKGVKKKGRRPGLVIRFRDGGGDRAHTVAALQQTIDRLRASGYGFATVSQAAGVRYTPPTEKKLDMLGGTTLIWVLRVSSATARVTPYMFILFFGLVMIRVVTLLVTAFLHKRRRRGAWGEPVVDTVSVVIPAYNEEAGIAGTVMSVLASDHPVEIIVVDDGSTDGTVDMVERLKSPSVRVIRRPNGGKPAAISTGVAAASHDLVVLIDGDTVIEPDTVREIVQPFSDPAIGAVAGNAKVANRRGILGRSQHVEYVTSCNLDRRMYDLLRCLPTVPGAIGAFRRVAIADAGGVPRDTSAEDTDLTIVVGRVGWRVVYAERARAWTEVPGTLRQFWLQRHRWNYGTLQALWKHRGSFGRRGRFTMFGMVALPYMLVTNLVMPLLSPMVDLMALYSLLRAEPQRAAVIWFGLIVLQFITTFVAFILDGERLRTLWVVPFQQLLYRQIMYLVTVHAVVTALLGLPLHWHKLHRAGLAEAPAVR